MRIPQPAQFPAVTALVESLDDATLRSGHAVLDHRRALDFSAWMDAQLGQFESRFRRLCTHRSLRLSLGR